MKDINARWFHRDGMGPDPIAMHGAPVSFSADIGPTSPPTAVSDMNGLAPGQTGVFDTSALQNGYRTPYYIDEIRMRCWASIRVGVENLQLGGFATAFQFRAGPHAFSKVAVPMGLYAPNYNGQFLQANGSGGAGVPSAVIGTSVRWLLPRPLFMQPGDVISATVERSATAMLMATASPSAGQALLNVGVTYVGRALPPGASAPLVKNVPWVAYFPYTIADNYSQAMLNGFNPFQNPFTQALRVHRLTGKMADASATGNGRFIEKSASTVVQSMLPSASGKKYVTCYIEDSAGYKVTRRFSSVGSIFDVERNAWTFNRALGAREGLNMQFQTQGTNPAVGDTFCVGMIAHREEAA